MAFTIEKYLNDEKNKEQIIGILQLYNTASLSDNFTEILIATPAGTILSKAVWAIKNSTDLPVEIAFFNVIHIISAFCLSRNITIDFDGQTLLPDLHSIILAPSGSGKTYQQKILNNSIPEEYKIPEFPNPDTDAAFFESLLTHNNSFFQRDEYAQFLKTINTDKNMAKGKDYLLRVYDNSDITRTTKKEGEKRIEKPALTILGSTVDKTFTNYVTEEMLLDGLAQRFSYIYATERADKKPRYNAHKHIEDLKNEFTEIFKRVVYDEYIISQEALSYFDNSYAALIQVKQDVDNSFFRRIHFKIVKYALIYHIVLKKDNNVIDLQDMEWADRIVYKNLNDLKKLLSNYNISELAKKVETAEKLKQKYDKEGKKLTTRNLIQSCSFVKNSAEAKFIMSLIENNK